MPFKSKKKRNEYMKKYREKQKKKIQELQHQFPDVYTLIFGQEKKARRKRK